MPGKPSNENNRNPPSSLGVSQTVLFKEPYSKKMILEHFKNVEKSLGKIENIFQEVNELLSGSGENTAPQNK